MRRVVSVSIAFAVLLGATAFIGGADDTRTYRAQFSRAVQLFPGGKVRVVGVDVGQITDVQNSRDGVEVTFTVDDPQIQLPADVQAAIIPVSLLGERYIQLLPAYTGGPTLPENSLIGADRTAVPAEPDELLRSLQDYFGALDPAVVGRFVGTTARLLEGNGQELGELIVEASELVQTLSAKRGDLAAIIVQFDRLSRALATRQAGIQELIRNYNTVATTLTGNRVALEGTITGLSDAAEQLASLLVAHRRPLHQDVRTLTRTGRTVTKNIDRLTETGKWAVRLFRAASNAVDYNKDWLRLNNQGQELVGLIVMRLEERLMDWCMDLGLPVCSLTRYWEREVPSLFCFADRCPEPPKPNDTVEEQLTQAIEQVPELVNDLLERARDLACVDAEDRLACLEKKKALIHCADSVHPERCLRRRAIKLSCGGTGDVQACIEEARHDDLQDLVEGLLEQTLGSPPEVLP
ncbi:MAG: MCE family protein [Actinomycetota bacterium]|nr:MCE family protein [Actinomycetota bacterium]